MMEITVVRCSLDDRLCPELLAKALSLFGESP